MRSWASVKVEVMRSSKEEGLRRAMSVDQERGERDWKGEWWDILEMSNGNSGEVQVSKCIEAGRKLVGSRFELYQDVDHQLVQVRGLLIRELRWLVVGLVFFLLRL